MQKSVDDIPAINKDFRKLEQVVDGHYITNQKGSDRLDEKIDKAKKYLETRIDSFQVIEDKVKSAQTAVSRIESLMLATKTELQN